MMAQLRGICENDIHTISLHLSFETWSIGHLLLETRKPTVLLPKQISEQEKACNHVTSKISLGEKNAISCSHAARPNNTFLSPNRRAFWVLKYVTSESWKTVLLSPKNRVFSHLVSVSHALTMYVLILHKLVRHRWRHFRFRCRGVVARAMGRFEELFGRLAVRPYHGLHGSALQWVTDRFHIHTKIRLCHYKQRFVIWNVNLKRDVSFQPTFRFFHFITE